MWIKKLNFYSIPIISIHREVDGAMASNETRIVEKLGRKEHKGCQARETLACWGPPWRSRSWIMIHHYWRPSSPEDKSENEREPVFYLCDSKGRSPEYAYPYGPFADRLWDEMRWETMHSRNKFQNITVPQRNLRLFDMHTSEYHFTQSSCHQGAVESASALLASAMVVQSLIKLIDHVRCSRDSEDLAQALLKAMATGYRTRSRRRSSCRS